MAFQRELNNSEDKSHSKKLNTTYENQFSRKASTKKLSPNKKQPLCWRTYVRNSSTRQQIRECKSRDMFSVQHFSPKYYTNCKINLLNSTFSNDTHKNSFLNASFVSLNENNFCANNYYDSEDESAYSTLSHKSYKHEIFTKDIATCTEDYNDLFQNDIVNTRNFDQQPTNIYDKEHVFNSFPVHNIDLRLPRII